MTINKIAEILENNGYDIENSKNSDKITAVKSGCENIVFWEDSTVTGWKFKVGKNELTGVYEAMQLSCNRVTT